MNPIDLSVNQLKRAAAIKERIEALNKELRGILGEAGSSRATPKKTRTMSAAVKRKIAAAQRARWAKLQGQRSASRPAKSAAKAKRRVSAATRAKLAAKLKAFWAAKRAGKK